MLSPDHMGYYRHKSNKYYGVNIKKKEYSFVKFWEDDFVPAVILV